MRIQLPDERAHQKFRGLDIAVDHGVWKGDFSFETDLSQAELEVLDNAEIAYEVMIEDVSAFYAERLKDSGGVPKAASTVCDADEITTPSGFSLGSMGGYLTYDEFLAHLDNMATQYPDLITAKQEIGTFQTWESRPIYWVRISDNATQDENEPEVLYTALHHAREPISLSQLIYYMYYLLENYSTDPTVKELIDNTEMYFIPMVNPDGYIYNETTNPNGGGMWRKNRRSNGGGDYGVDNNRNYSYQWGVSGASSNPSSETYKGPSPMSEPENQAMEWFAQQHDFVTALNFHSYADQLLFPWGYSDNLQCPNHDDYTAISAEMVSQNGYLNQQSSLLYPAAGDSDDWGYGETTEKPRIYSMTCEVGGNSDGFWPSQDRIIPLCKENVYLNLTLARSAANYARITDREPTFIYSSGGFDYRLERLGWQGGTFTVAIEPIEGIASVGNPNVHPGLDIGEEVTDSIQVTLENGLEAGDAITYVLTVDNGIYVSRDTVYKIYGTPVPLFANGGDPISDWDGTSWGLTNSTFVSSPNSLADSPNGNYTNNSTRTMETAGPIDLTGLSFAYLRFYAKWEIEQGWDYAQVSASTDGNSWTPLCGQYTVIGNEYQDEGEPVYDGFQTTWVQDELSLNDFVGEEIYLQFKMVSDQSVTEDGIYIDDVEVLGISDVTVSNISNNVWNRISVYPNPTECQFRLKLPEQAEVSVLTVDGKQVYSGQLTSGTHQIDAAGWAKGMYLLKVQTASRVLAERLMVQ